MKLPTLLLAGSIAANVALIGFILVGSSEDTGSAPRVVVRKPVAKTSATTEAAAPGPESWADLTGNDLVGQRDRLRAAGFPPEIIRAILAAQIRESFAARRKALEQAQGEVPFWKNQMRDPKLQAAFRDLSVEQDKILKDLLGHDARDDDPSYAAYLHNRFGNLPDEKIDQLRQIQDDYDRQRSDLYMNARGGNMLPDDQQKLQALDKAMRAEFATVMTPEQFADYDLRSSNTAQQLRYNLSAFDATEPEYRSIFQVQKAFDDQFGQMYGMMSQDQMKARNDAQKQLNDDLKTTLGPDRYADYQRATDYNYRQTSQLVARLDLPPDTANQIYAVQQDIQQRAGTIRSDRSLTPDDRTQQLNALTTEAQTKITGALGPTGYEAYKQYGGSWLQNLAPRPAIPSLSK